MKLITSIILCFVSSTMLNNGRRYTQECVACTVKKPDVEYRPCKHICVCAECHKEWKDKARKGKLQCPLCNQHIMKTLVLDRVKDGMKKFKKQVRKAEFVQQVNASKFLDLAENSILKENAIEYFEKAITIYRENDNTNLEYEQAVAWVNLGDLGGGHGHCQKECYFKAVQLDLEYVSTWYNFGILRKGNLEVCHDGENQIISCGAFHTEPRLLSISKRDRSKQFVPNIIASFLVYVFTCDIQPLGMRLYPQDAEAAWVNLDIPRRDEYLGDWPVLGNLEDEVGNWSVLRLRPKSGALDYKKKKRKVQADTWSAMLLHFKHFGKALGWLMLGITAVEQLFARAKTMWSNRQNQLRERESLKLFISMCLVEKNHDLDHLEKLLENID